MNMNKNGKVVWKGLRNYLSVVLLFVPAILFGLFLVFFLAPNMEGNWPWQFSLLTVAGIFATVGGVLDWRYHRNPLRLKLSVKERDSEAYALFFGSVPLFGFMCLASLEQQPEVYLIPILVTVLVCTAFICYDEFVFHRKRCNREETLYHRMLVFGNGIAWLAWMHWIFVRSA
jgi:hypothetical protein